MIKKITIILNKVVFYLNAHFIGFIKIISLKQKNIVEIRLKKPSNREIDNDYDEVYSRLFNFYKKLKENEPNTPEIVKPSSLWQNHISKDYKFLDESYETNNLKNFSYFLNNFGNWNNYLGIEHNTLLKRYSKNFILKSYLKNEIFLKHYKIWKDTWPPHYKYCNRLMRKEKYYKPYPELPYINITFNVYGTDGILTTKEMHEKYPIVDQWIPEIKKYDKLRRVSLKDAIRVGNWAYDAN